MARVLVVEDHTPMRDLLIAIVSQSLPHATIDGANDGVNGLERYQQQSYDLVITDHRMPRMSGTALIAAIRALDAAVPIIAISGSISIKQECLGAGATLFLDKSSGLTEIGKIASRLLPARTAALPVPA